mmetsp:Transcript_89561/g.256543  ORF Transcript_89561/g.256543 Transcript_89561/m.256543 type:complete len:106 (+) Transcript_89561:931-1248(+)
MGRTATMTKQIFLRHPFEFSAAFVVAQHFDGSLHRSSSDDNYFAGAVASSEYSFSREQVLRLFSDFNHAPSFPCGPPWHRHPLNFAAVGQGSQCAKSALIPQQTA